MPRFFFDVHDGKVLTDNEGTVFPDLETARREALRTASEMLKEVREIWTGEPWTMIVRDDRGETVAKLSFCARFNGE